MSRHMYYHSFPHAPCELVSGISGACGIPTIVGAYVGKEYNSIFLDVYQNADFRIKAQHLYDIADACGVTLEELEVSPGIDDAHLSITLETSAFDFSYLFEPDSAYVEYNVKQLPGAEDSEESIEAHEKIINR